MEALLAPYVDRQIQEVTSAVARLGDVKMKSKEHLTQVQALPPSWTMRARTQAWPKRESRVAPSPFYPEGEQQANAV